MYEIQSVSYKNQIVKIKYKKGEEFLTIASEELPHADFVSAIADLKSILIRHLQVNPERIDTACSYKNDCSYVKFMNERVSATGLVVVKKERDGETRITYKVQGGIQVVPVYKNVEVESLSLTYDKDWFTYETKTGVKVHTPNESPTYLTDADIALIENVVLKAGAFIDGERSQGILPMKVATKEEVEEFKELQEEGVLF